LLRRGPRRGRVLAGDQHAVGDHVGREVGALAVVRAEPRQLIFEQEGDGVGQPDSLFLTIGEAGDLAPRDQRRAIRRLGVREDRGGMADRGERLARGEGLLDDLLRIRVVGEIPQRTVAAGIEDRVIGRRFDRRQQFGSGELLLGLGVGLEAARGLGLRVGGGRLGVDWGLAALGAGQGQRVSGILQDIIRRGEFFEPEAGLLAGIAKLVVAGEDHQDVHACRSRKGPRPGAR